MKTKYDVELLKVMSLFEKVTKAHLKDCFYSRDKLLFIVESGDMGKALGKKKMNIEKLEKALNRKIKIVEFSSDVQTFIRNLMYPLRILDIQEENGIFVIKGPDTKTKGLMIGARAQNLRSYEEITQKYFDNVKELKVV